jgi:predicted esterase
VALGRRRALWTAALALAACRAERSSPKAVAEPVPASAPVVASVAPPKGLRPLEAAAFTRLEVPGFGEAVVSVPIGATSPRAVALALHGNFDRPEWQCEVWRRITAGEVFVLCPRGIPRRDVPKDLDRWEWGSVEKTKAELLAALGALRGRFPEHVQCGPVVFTGFSLGAILGARLIQDPELDVAAAVLTEGGYQGWTAAKARALAPRVRRVLFACGQTDCRNAYRYQLERVFQAAGISSGMVADVKAGHTYDDAVAALIRAEWPSILSSLKYD